MVESNPVGGAGVGPAPIEGSAVGGASSPMIGTNSGSWRALWQVREGYPMPKQAAHRFVPLAAGLLLVALAPAAQAAPPTCFGRAPTIVGTHGDDTISGTDDTDVIAGLSGDDILRGESLDDFVCGNSGGDTLYGDRGNDRLNGGTGNDFIAADDFQVPSPSCVGLGDVPGDEPGDPPFRNTLIGGPGDDSLAGSEGNDTLNAGAGTDCAYGSYGQDIVSGGGGEDTLLGGGNPDRLSGNGGNDYVEGGIQSDRLFGNAGSDTLNSAGDNEIDSVDGGPEIDSCTTDPQDVVSRCP